MFGGAFKIYETGAGTGILTVAVDQTTVNLSGFTLIALAIGTIV